MVLKKQSSFASIPSSTFLFRQNGKQLSEILLPPIGAFSILSLPTKAVHEPLQGVVKNKFRGAKQSFSKNMMAKSQSLHSVQTIIPNGGNQRPTITSRKNLELPLFFDRCFDKNRIKTFIGWLLANFGENATVYVVEKLKNLGFYFATEAGISLSIDDLQVPLSKNWFLSQAEQDIRRNQNNFQCGNLTPVEQSQQLLDRWHQTSEILRESVIQSFRLTNTLNPVYMMAFSGARGNISQVRQLVGMRGLMADPQGQIISFPIRSNFREGLTLTEYVISCYGARKGVVDTALRTADSGYLTRRLVDVSQHVVVWTFDCKTDAGIHLTEMKEGKKVILSLKKRILGRVLAQEIPTIAFRNQQISAQLAQQIASLREHVLVRSPLSCSVPNSVCQLCYGWSLSRGRIVSLGEAVGVIAAQSIGEPGTQLTMRTFHTGGVFSGDVIDEIRAPHDGSVHFLQPLSGQLIRTSHGKIAYLTRASGGVIIKNDWTEKKAEHFAAASAPDKGGKGDYFLQGEKDTFLHQQNAKHFIPQNGKQESMVGEPLIKKDSTLILSNPHFVSQHVNQTLINLEPGTALFVRQGEKVIAKQLLAEYSSISTQTKERVEAQHQVYSDQKGEIFFDDVLLGKKLKKEEPELEKGFILNTRESGLQNQFKHDTSKEGDVSTFSQGENVTSAASFFSQNEKDRTKIHFDREHFPEQNIQKIDPQSGRKIDIVTSLKLNTLWVLSGTLFEPPIFSPLYTKIGDLVDKTTLLTLIQNELNLQTPHLDGEYVVSAQLKKNKTTKRKDKLLAFFRKNIISNKLPKILQRENLEDNRRKRDSLFLNEFSLNLTITNVKYKKSGYFFTNFKKEKPYNFYSLFLQLGSINLFKNLVNFRNYKENSKDDSEYFVKQNVKVNTKMDFPLTSPEGKLFEDEGSKNWNIVFGKKKTNFPSGVFLQDEKIEKILRKEEHQFFVRKQINNIFVLAEPKQMKTFLLKSNDGEATFFASQSNQLRINYSEAGNQNVSFFQKETDILRVFAANKIIKTEFILEKLKEEAALLFNFLKEKSLSRNPFSKQDFRVFIPKYSTESAKAKDLWWRTHNLCTPYRLSIEEKLSIESWPDAKMLSFSQSEKEGKAIAPEVSWFKRKRNLVNLSEKRRILKKYKNFLTENLVFTSHFITQNTQKLKENKKNINSFFTTTSLNQPFSNRREFKNEFLLQWFSPYFKTETGGLIYTTNYYCNKRSSETHIFLTAEENYGKKNIGKMNFGRRKKSFNIVSFRELLAPSICLANVLLNGKRKPSSSFNNFLTSFSEDFGNILSMASGNCAEGAMLSSKDCGEATINRMIEDKYENKGLSFPSFPEGKPWYSNITHKNVNIGLGVGTKETKYSNFVEPNGLPSKDFGEATNVFSGKIDLDKKQLKRTFVRNSKVISVDSLLNETFFLQNQDLKKELFFLRKKENFSVYSVSFQSRKTETLDTTFNFLIKGFLSFKKKWVETDIPLGYQKNLQGSQIPFYSIENGVLKNNLTPSFFTNQYSNYWARKKSKKLSASFLKNFFSLTFTYPLPHIKVKKRDLDTKKICLVDNLYLNKNEFLGRNDILIRNFNKKPINQKELWLTNQERKTLKATHTRNTDFVYQNPLLGVVQKSSFLCNKQKRRFYLAPLLTKLRLDLGKKKILKCNPFPSKGNYSSSAFLFRINMRAISFHDLQKQSSFVYNPYPYSQPLFLEFLQNKSTANFHYLTKSLKTSLDLLNKHIVLQSKTLFSKRSLLAFDEIESKLQRSLNLGETRPKGLLTPLPGVDVAETKLLQSFDFEEIKPSRRLALQAENNDRLTGFLSFPYEKTELSVGKPTENLIFAEQKLRDSFALPSTEQHVKKEKQKNSLKNLKVVGDYKFPQNIISCNTCNNSENLKHDNKRFTKFSSFLQKQIKKISIKKQKKTVEKLQRLNLQIRPGWLYLPKDQSQTAKAHQSFIPPFQQNIDEILFDQFPVYIESILRKSFEEQLADKYLQPSTNAVDFYKTKTLLEKSQLQKFINQISTVSKKSKQSIKGLKVSKERSNKFLLSLRETFWRGSTFSSFIENDFTTSHYNNKNLSKLTEKDSLYETNLPTNFLKHIKMSSRSSFLSFLLRNKKERKNTKFIFLRPVLINPVKIVFQVVTNKFCRFNSIQSFALSCVNDVNFDFSQDFFSQSQIIDKKLNQDNICIKHKVNPGFSLCLPQISRIYFVKNKPFSDFILVPRKLNFHPVKTKSYIFSDKKPISYKSEYEVSKSFLKEKQDGKHINAAGNGLQEGDTNREHFTKQNITNAGSSFSQSEKDPTKMDFVSNRGSKQYESETNYPTDHYVKDTITKGENFVEKTFGNISKSNHNNRFYKIKSKEQDAAEKLTLSEKNKDLICSGRQILISINNASKMLSFGKVKSKVVNKHKNLSKTLQKKTFLIENFSTRVDTNYSSFLILIPNSLKKKKNANIVTTILSSPEARTKENKVFQKHSTTAKLQSFFTYDRSKNIVPKVELAQAIKQNREQIRNVVFDETPGFQRKKPSFYEFFREKSKLWLLIRKVTEYPLLDISIFKQKTRLYKENQTFFEKELIYSSTPLSLYLSNRILFSSKFNKQKKKEVYLSFYHSPKVSLKIRESLFYLLDTFSKSEKQDFTNISTDLTKNTFGTFYETKCKNKMKFGHFNDIKIKEEKLKLPLNLFSCQKMFWQIFDLYHQNVQKNKFFEGKQLVFIKKILDTEKKNLLKNKISSQESHFFYKVTTENRTWSFQKENLENLLFSKEKEQTVIRSFKQSYLLHFFVNLHISKQFPLQRIKIKTTFEKIEGSIQTSSCAHYLNSQKIQTTVNLKNYSNTKIGDLNLQNKKTKYLQKDYFAKQNVNETLFLQSKNLDQPKFSAFLSFPGGKTWLNINKIDFVEENLLFSLKNQSLAKKLRTLSRKNLNSLFSDKIEKDLLRETLIFTEQFTLRDQVFRQNFQHFTRQNVKQSHDHVIFDKIKPQFFSEKPKFSRYSFTPFARDLSLTLSFIAKINQSWFFSLTNDVKNQRKVFQSFNLQSKKLRKRAFISASKTELNEKNRKQEYLKEKKSITKETTSYPLKEKSSYTTLLLDQTITTHDKTPVATTALMSREEGEIENLKNKSTSLILKNSDIEILLTKNEKPLLVVGQLIRYGEQIANGIATPKSGQIIQVDSNRVTLRKAQPILFPRGGSVDVSHGDYVKEGSPLLSLSYQRLVTGDIVQGIPKIEQLFEARETEGGQPLLSSLHSELEAIFLSYSTQLGLKLAVRESFKEIQQIIVDRVQRVYIAQGVLIADKHFEVVIRQMTSKVRILDGGRPGFLYGELVDLRRVELLNAGVPFANEQAIYEPIILGISKACLEAEGFLSPASFQETTRVLSLAAIERKTDFLRGIKERVILGDVIQAGTGFALYDRPIRKIKQEECMDLSLSVLHNAHSILSTNQYYKQL